MTGTEQPGRPNRRALLIVNAHSRGGRKPEAYVEALAGNGLELLQKECSKREHLSALIREHRKDVDCVVLGGGDGTVTAAAVALQQTGLPLGILPLGTGNDLARTLGIPTNPAGAAAVILAGESRRIDLGSVNGQPFFNVASVGLTVEITERLTKASKRRFGRLAYAWTAFRVAMGHRRFSAIIRCNGTIHRVRTMQVTVGNGRHYGAGLVVHSTARIDDHLLDIYSLEPTSRWRLLVMGRAFAAGEHGQFPDVRTERSAEVELLTRTPHSISADGEIVAVTPARFSVLPDAVTVYAPPLTAPAAP